MSISHRSRLGSPSTIHSAITFPIPPAPARPCAQNPHATKYPSTSVSPRQNSLSGVNPSGPLISFVTLISSIAGTRRRELLTISSNRSHSSSSVRPLKPGGICRAPDPVRAGTRARCRARTPHHQACPVLAEVDQQVRVAQRRQALSAAVTKRLRHQILVRHRDHRHADTRHATDLGAVHPARVHDQPRSMSPRSVRTPRTRPSSTSIPVTRAEVKIWHPPAARRRRARR